MAEFIKENILNKMGRSDSSLNRELEEEQTKSKKFAAELDKVNKANDVLKKEITELKSGKNKLRDMARNYKHKYVEIKAKYDHIVEDKAKYDHQNEVEKEVEKE